MPLPELAAESIDGLSPDVVVRRRPVDGPSPGTGSLPFALFEEGRAFFAWSALGRFLIRGSHEIEVDADAGVDSALINAIILGPLIATVLHMRGYLILHGSAIALDRDRAVLFLGDKGAGKSTLAAEFVAAGYGIVNDDVVALRADSGEPARIVAGPPLLKLSLAAIGGLAALPATILPMAMLADPKRRLRVDQGSDGMLDVAAIYILHRGGQATVERLDPVAALNALMRHSYMFKYGTQAFSASSSASQFIRCGTIADRIGASILTVPDGFERLREARALVLREIRK